MNVSQSKNDLNVNVR